MRIKQVLAFLSVAAVSACALAEPSVPASASACRNTVTVQGGASPLVQLTPAEAQDASGTFKLEDGRVLKLSSLGSKVFVEVDGKREELLPVSRTHFVARASGTELAVDDLRFPETVKLTQFRP